MGWWTRLVGWLGGVTDPLKTIFDGIDALHTSDEEKGILKNKAIELHLEKLRIELDRKKIDVQDRSNARNMYKSDSAVQKIFAVVFLIAFFGIAWYMLNLYQGEQEISDVGSNFVYAVFGAVSSYMTMIVSFFYGSSSETKNLQNNIKK